MDSDEDKAIFEQECRYAHRQREIAKTPEAYEYWRGYLHALGWTEHNLL